MVLDWHPTASIAVLRKRADLTGRIREYFRRCGVMEVMTPVVSRNGTTEPGLRNRVLENRPGHPRQFLRTSPEAAMKRLLAAGSGDIYQLGPVFRDDEISRLHLPEFTLLEWYRIGLDHHQLMDEVDTILNVVGLDRSIERVSYAALWEEVLGVNPHMISTARLRQIGRMTNFGLTESNTEDRAALFDRIYVHYLEHALAGRGAVFVYDFPIELRGYARRSPSCDSTAERFELIIDGVEIANGYHEIGDSEEQQACFEEENALRAKRGLPVIVPDTKWLDALTHGFPSCSGVAIGLERLIMVMDNIEDIGGAVSFAFDLF